MKIELHFKTVVEVSQEDYENNNLDNLENCEVFFPAVYGNSLLKEYLTHIPDFTFTGYSIMPELEIKLINSKIYYELRKT